MKGVPIRVKLTAWYAAVLLAGMSLFGAGVLFGLERRLVAGVDAWLDGRVAGLSKVLEIEGGLKNPEELKTELAEFAQEMPQGELLSMTDPAGKRLLPAKGQPVFEAQPGLGQGEYRTESRGGKRYRVLRSLVRYRGAGYEVAAGASMEETEAALRMLKELLLGLIPLVLLVACLGGYWISGRALRPVDEITEAARTITVQNLSQRLTVPPAGDELSRLSQAWNETLERLEGAVGRIRQFTADASHELRTPLALIRTTAELALRRERPAGEYREALAQIEHESEKMAELTEALLELAREDAGVTAMPLTKSDVNEIVQEVGRACRGMAEERGVKLETMLAEGPAMAAAHTAGLRRLLLILVENALHHTEAGGSVILKTALNANGVKVSVADTGEGIPAEALAHVFERFFRVDGARSGRGRTGLGLSIAQGIAQAHGSELTVESEPGLGSTFTIWLKPAK